MWLAGPLSGLLVQPIVGAISDSSTSPYRRRQFILLSTLLIIVSTLCVAYARQIASVISSVAGLGDWDPKEEEWEAAVARWVGVSGFWVLDFGLNGLQGSLRVSLPALITCLTSLALTPCSEHLTDSTTRRLSSLIALLHHKLPHPTPGTVARRILEIFSDISSASSIWATLLFWAGSAEGSFESSKSSVALLWCSLWVSRAGPSRRRLSRAKSAMRSVVASKASLQT